MKWNDYRLKDLENLKLIETIYPTIISNTFLTKLEEYSKLIKELLKETSELRKAIMNLTQNTSFDVQNVVSILQEYFKEFPEEFYINRKELLSRWAHFLVQHGMSKKESYLIKTVLPPRLNLVIDTIKENPEKYYYIEIQESKENLASGHPEARVKLLELIVVQSVNGLIMVRVKLYVPMPNPNIP